MELQRQNPVELKKALDNGMGEGMSNGRSRMAPIQTKRKKDA